MNSNKTKRINFKDIQFFLVMCYVKNSWIATHLNDAKKDIYEYQLKD